MLQLAAAFVCGCKSAAGGIGTNGTNGTNGTIAHLDSQMLCLRLQKQAAAGEGCGFVSMGGDYDPPIEFIVHANKMVVDGMAAWCYNNP